MRTTIELYDEHNKVLGFIDGSSVLDRKKKPIGKIDPDAIRDKNGEVLLNMSSDGKLDYDFDGPGSPGYVKAGKIFDKADGLRYAYQPKTGEIIDEMAATRVVVKGDTSKVGDKELVGIAAIFFELFA
jgi:hypothetical protein